MTSPFAHEAVDDEIGGAVRNEHQVVYSVDSQQPGGVRGRLADAVTVYSLVQDVDLLT